MKRSHLAIMGRLIKLVVPLLPFMILAIVMGVVGFLCSTFITIFGGYALLDVLNYSTWIDFETVCIAILFFALIRGFLRYAEQACNHFIAFKLLALIRDHVFKALRRLSPAKLEGKDKGNLISIITSDIELLEVFYAHTISPIAIAVAMSLIMVFFIGRLHPLLGGIAALAYLCVGVVIPVLISKKSQDDGLQFRREVGDLNSFILDHLRGLKETIQYQRGEQTAEELSKRSEALSIKEEKLKKMLGRNMAITNTTILVFSLLMLLGGAYLNLEGIISFEEVVISLIAMMSSFGPVVALANLGSSLQNTLASGNRVLDILDETPVVEEVHDGINLQFERAELKHVDFAYDNEKILEDFSLRIPSRQILGIVGKSGSGKSTLLKLLMRFWDCNRGEVCLNDVDVKQINTSSLRENEGYVTQETQLFHDTLLNNIKIAKLDASEEEVKEACRKASVHDFIMSLPDGYQSQVGELGETLSGGERQRIGLARAFLHDAPFILLDEPTSNLDSLNEAVILKSLKEASKEKTVVLVSHRESTMCVADEVIHMAEGRMS